jgi:hypothetical protein
LPLTEHENPLDRICSLGTIRNINYLSFRKTHLPNFKPSGGCDEKGFPEGAPTKPREFVFPGLMPKPLNLRHFRMGEKVHFFMRGQGVFRQPPASDKISRF